MSPTLTLLLLLPTLIKAFDDTLISGEYSLFQGLCPSPLTISQNSTILPTNKIVLNNTSCTGPSLTLTSTKNTSLHTFLFETRQIGSFLSASRNITCGNYTIHSITLFAPNDQITLPSALSPTNSSISLENDYVYLLTTSCIYTKRKPEEDGIVQQILNTVTECLPGDALINTPNGLTPLNTLKTNSLVQTTAGFQPIITWTHRDPNPLTTFININLSNHSLQVTTGHYVFADGKLIQARFLSPGMSMQSSSGHFVINSLSYVVKKGVFNPHTPAGDFLVGEHKIRVSCYSSAVQPFLAHALFAPLRGLFHLGFQSLRRLGESVEVLVEKLRYTGLVSWLSA